MLALLLAPLVAVLPFRDASGGGAGGVGEAVRAAAAAELKAAGVATVPRDTLERAMDLLGDELEKQQLDASPSLAQLARTTGATAVLAGAYDVRGDRVKLWARFYQGKRGRLLSTTTVGGPGTEFLQLVHGVNVELVRAAKLDAKLAPKPMVRSFRAVELFGQAEVAAGEEKRRELLQRALQEDPGFELALKAMEELPVDPARVAEQLLTRFAELSRQRRYHQLLAEAGAAVAHPPPPVPQLSEQVPEVAQVMIVVAHDRLHDDEALLREGRRYLSAHPKAKSAEGVKALVDQAEERRRVRFEGVAKAREALEKMSVLDRKDICRVASVYEDTNQLREAREAYAACVGSGRPPVYLLHLIWVEFRLGNFASVPPLLEKLRAASPPLYQRASHLADELPAD